MMQSFSVTAQTSGQQPPRRIDTTPRVLIDNSSVTGEKKLKFQSELNPENDKPKRKYIQKLSNPISFCLPPPDPKHYRDRGQKIPEPTCLSVDYFFCNKRFKLRYPE